MGSAVNEGPQGISVFRTSVNPVLVFFIGHPLLPPERVFCFQENILA